MKTIEELGISLTPWHAKVRNLFEDIGWVYDKNDRVIFGVLLPSHAHLIAAAPELYEALAALLNCSEKEAPFTKESGMSIAMDMARKAIRKAGGEE
jgi:hypothetical protein